MRKPTADQLARLLSDLERGMLADLPPDHPARVEAPPSHYDQWRQEGRWAAWRLDQSGLLVEAREKIAAKLREEAVVRGARQVVECEEAVREAELRLGKAVAALDAALMAVAKYGRGT